MAGPRLSIIPGDFATDSRADVWHFRVLNLIGRHTNDAGWCRLKQITIADEIGLTRECVNRKIKDLVSWGYVEKRALDASGRSIWYRTILDRPASPPSQHVAAAEPDDGADMQSAQDGASDAAPVNSGSQAGYNTGLPITPDVIATDHTCCDRTQSQQERLSLTISSTKEKTPPQPPALRGERGRVKKSDEVEVAIADVRRDSGSGDDRQSAIDHLLAPLVRQRKLDAPSLTGTLRSLADWIGAKGLGKDELVAVLARLLAARKATVKASDVEAEIKSQIGRRPMAPELSGHPELSALWPKVTAELSAMIGPEQFSAWCSTLVPVAYDGRLFRVATHEGFIARHVERTFPAQLRVAVQAVWPEAQAVDVVHRPRSSA